MPHEPHRDRVFDALVRDSLQQTNPPSACPDADAIAAWFERALPTHEMGAVERHVSTCHRCQSVVAMMARAEPAAVGARAGWDRWRMGWLVPLTAAAAAVLIWIVVPRPDPPAQLADGRAAQEAGSAPSAPLGTEPPARAPAAPLQQDRVDADRSAPPAPDQADQLEAGRAETRSSAAKTEQAPTRPAFADERTPAVPAPAAPPAPTAPTAPTAPMIDGISTISGESAVPLGSPRVEQRAQAPVQRLPEPPELPATAGRGSGGQGRGGRRNVDTSSAAPPSGGSQRLERPAGPPPPAAARVPADPSAAAVPASAPSAALEAPGFLARSSAPVEVPSPEALFRWRIHPDGGVERTADGGTTWTPVVLPDGVVIRAGSAPTRLVCWLVGRGGTVLVNTPDGGFRRVAFPVPVDLAEVTATSASSAIVTTSDGRAFGTADGGTTWQAR